MLVREQGSGESRASPSPLMQVTQLVHRLFQLLMQRREQNSEIERLGEVPVHARFFGLAHVVHERISGHGKDRQCIT